MICHLCIASVTTVGYSWLLQKSCWVHWGLFQLSMGPWQLFLDRMTQELCLSSMQATSLNSLTNLETMPTSSCMFPCSGRHFVACPPSKALPRRPLWGSCRMLSTLCSTWSSCKKWAIIQSKRHCPCAVCHKGNDCNWIKQQINLRLIWVFSHLLSCWQLCVVAARNSCGSLLAKWQQPTKSGGQNLVLRCHCWMRWTMRFMKGWQDWWSILANNSMKPEPLHTCLMLAGQHFSHNFSIEGFPLEIITILLHSVISNLTGNGPCQSLWRTTQFVLASSTGMGASHLVVWQGGKASWSIRTPYCTYFWTEWTVTTLLWMPKCVSAGGRRSWTHGFNLIYFFEPYAPILWLANDCWCWLIVSSGHWLALSLAKEGLQRCCGAFIACMAEFNRAYPAEFVRKEEASILRALHGKIMIHTMMRCILFLRLVVILLGVLTLNLNLAGSCWNTLTATLRTCSTIHHPP